MSIIEIYHPASATYGWQARAHVRKGERLTKFLSWGQHGGRYEAMRKARWHEVRLKAQAKRLRGAA
jgi:hypothetical protein